MNGDPAWTEASYQLALLQGVECLMLSEQRKSVFRLVLT